MSKRLVVCCDGTWNTLVHARDAAGQTNVARMYLSVAPSDADGVRQLCGYVAGVGTGGIDRLRGGAFGMGLSGRVKDAYRFLVEHYAPGDEVWFFGFSRGAFTARSAAGLVRKCGILRPEEAGRIDEAYRLYRRRGPEWHPDTAVPTRFRADHGYGDVPIRFIGVWDTVGALGIPAGPWNPLRLINRRWSFHDTTLSSHVRDARHAVSVDERRGPFRPTMWRRSDRATPASQALYQAWFAGAHSDVGGGVRPATGEEAGASAGLSQTAFEWMMREAEDAGLGVDWTLCPRGGSGPSAPPTWMVARARERGLGDIDPAAAVRALIAPADPHGPVHPSRRGIYRLLRAHDRTIPYPDDGDDGSPAPFPGQWMADSVVDRLATMPDYGRGSSRAAVYVRDGGAHHPVARRPSEGP